MVAWVVKRTSAISGREVSNGTLGRGALDQGVRLLYGTYVSTRKKLMAAYAITTARDQFADLVNRVAYGHERVRIVRRGRGLVAVVPIEDLALIEALEDELDLDAVRAALADPSNKTPVPWEQVRAELNL